MHRNKALPPTWNVALRVPAVVAAALLFASLVGCADTPVSDKETDISASSDGLSLDAGYLDVVDAGEAPEDVAGQDGDDAGAGTSDTGGPADTGHDSAVSSDAVGSADGSAVSLPKSTTTVAANTLLLDLGEHTVKKGTKVLGPFAFELPTDALSFVINVQGEFGVSYGVAQMTAPGGQTWVHTGWEGQQQNLGGQMCVSCLWRVAPSATTGAALAPNSPSTLLVPGTYTFSIGNRKRMQLSPFQPPVISHPPGTVHVTVAVKTAAKPKSSLPKTGVLNLNLYFTGATGLTAKTAKTDKKLATWLATLKSIYSQVGLSIGTISYTDIDAGFQVVDAVGAGPNSDFEELAELTAKSGWGVNVVFVRQIVAPQVGGAILGIAGGAPGPSGIQGSGRSAVLVATEPTIPGNVKWDPGAVIAHEAGHYLGLYHSSENNYGGFAPAVHDPLPDTPPNDLSNLMYFNGAAGGTKLTAQQGAVLRGNPWVLHTTGGQP
ncbi:MAG: hypothetical protein KC502_15025 [Myxococcales bacterium]|nr:hypothetical protein [Myxococcales bacterium]